MARPHRHHHRRNLYRRLRLRHHHHHHHYGHLMSYQMEHVYAERILDNSLIHIVHFGRNNNFNLCLDVSYD